jgi:hypothetical protein
LEAEGYLNIADIMAETIAPAISQPDITARILKEGAWDKQKIAAVLDESRRTQSQLRQGVQENADAIRGYTRRYQETGLETFGALAELHRTKAALGEAALASLAETIRLLETALQ